jgi:hypothetical protein
MKRLPLIAAAALALTASAPVIGLIATPAAAQGWRDDDGDTRDGDMRDTLRELLMDRYRGRQDLRDLLSDRLRTRQDARDFLMEHLRAEGQDRRGGLRERVGAWRERDDESDGGDWRGRLRQRIGERLGRGEEGGCYFLTRTLRDEDGSLFVLVRRRVCRD